MNINPKLIIISIIIPILMNYNLENPSILLNITVLILMDWFHKFPVFYKAVTMFMFIIYFLFGETVGFYDLFFKLAEEKHYPSVITTVESMFVYTFFLQPIYLIVNYPMSFTTIFILSHFSMESYLIIGYLNGTYLPIYIVGSIYIIQYSIRRFRNIILIVLDKLELMYILLHTTNEITTHFIALSLKYKNLLSFFQFLYNQSPLPKMNMAQLLSLREMFKDSLDIISDEIGMRPNERDQGIMSSDQCCICLDSKPNILFSPCNHQIVCSECLEYKIQNCYICKIPVLRWKQIHEHQYQVQLTEEQYRRETFQTTTSELIKLKNYLENNPNELKKLKNKNLF